MRVAICGLGRLGRSLLLLLPRAGIEAVGWRRGEAWPEADVYWITTRDDTIAEVAAAVPPGAIALHSAGARASTILPCAERAVLHPLMTFPGPEVGLPALEGVGARVEGTPRAVEVARRIARALGLVPVDVPGDPRLWHAAAVLASNHVAAVFADAVAVMVSAGVERDVASAVLRTLAESSLARVAEVGPAAITGPAARGDVATLAGHRSVLPPALVPAYDAVAERIVALRRGE